VNPLTTAILSTLFNELWSIAMTKLNDSTNDSIRVLKKASTKSLSGKSSLAYELTLDSKDEIHIRITKNTGGGFFSPENVRLRDIQSVLDEHPEGTPVTSFILQPLFHGKSVNTPAFLLAALAHEKLMYPMKGKKRSLEPAVDFTEKVSKLMASKATARKAPTSSKKKTANSTRKKTVTKKAIIKKKAMARKKTARSV
jgi:hypothetical protein